MTPNSDLPPDVARELDRIAATSPRFSCLGMSCTTSVVAIVLVVLLLVIVARSCVA